VSNGRIEVGVGLELRFDRASEAFEASEAVEFLLVADSGRLE